MGHFAGSIPWRYLDLKWKVESRHPIPEEWKKFFSRSSLLYNGSKPSNRFASHPVSAMLNYAYGILESKVRIQAVADGCDPLIGIMHDNKKPDRQSYVYDQMEPLRPVADRAVLKLITEETFSGADFDLQSDGVCRLNPSLLVK